VADLVAQGSATITICRISAEGPAQPVAVAQAPEEAGAQLRVRIRNNLVAQYFPELDLFWNNAEAENLAIVRGYLDPARIRQLTCEQFIARVSTHNGGLRQQRRLRHIWEAAGNSIGCGGSGVGT